ncbi:MAG: hypothetical protein JSS76_05310 [Bacteroidetes bacterium]|nr:hypothetical protein [Bacteroidota bacterium]
MKTVKLLVAVIFLMTISIGAQAQDKYEYATVSYRCGSFLSKGTISISQQGKYETIEFKLSEGGVFDNFTPVIEVVNKLSQEGWEVYGTTIAVSDKYPTTLYYLRKKKN